MTAAHSSPPPASSTAHSSAPAPLAGSSAQRTPDGQWWGVDSTTAITSAALANVRGFYAGGHDPLVWGRYVSGSYGLRPGELDFARSHHIYVYLLVPDDDCSVCDGGRDVCGNDRTADQARADALDAVAAARREAVAAGATLFKDIEQIGSCEGELSPAYLDTWYRTVLGGPYRPGFYGNAFRPNYDFPVAYCQMIKADPAAGRDLTLADDEPEPLIGAAPGSTGPANAPRFAPDTPACAPASATRIWQYGESLSAANVTDIDEVRPGTTGLLSPDGAVT